VVCEFFGCKKIPANWEFSAQKIAQIKAIFLCSEKSDICKNNKHAFLRVEKRIEDRNVLSQNKGGFAGNSIYC